MNKTIITPIVLLFVCFLCSSCTDPLGELGSEELIAEYELDGAYLGQVTPAFLGMAPVTTGEHEMMFTDMGDGRLHLYYDEFQEPPMPFVMTVDIMMTARKGPNNTLILEGEEGTFRADPPDGEPIDPDDAPPGIQLPDGAEGGMISHQATITGTYGEIEKEGETALRFDLELTPGLPLPVEILIYTHHKIQ